MTFSTLSRMLLLIILAASACKKKGTDQPTPIPVVPGTPIDSVKKSEFCFLPTKDASWRFHYQGSMMPDTVWGGHYMDTTWHFYSEITATGVDTFIKSRKYYIYTYKKVNHHTGYNPWTVLGRYYMREDTAGKTTVISKRISTTYTDDRPGIDFNIKPGDPIPYKFYHWPAGAIVAGDSIKLDGVSYQPLMMRVKGKDYFLQCYGIGSLGSVSNYVGSDLGGNGSTIRSLDFKYKKDSLHFDYDLFP